MWAAWGRSRARRPATVAALLVVALVAVFQTAALFLILGVQRDAAHIVDISGAQRMRSQQLAFLALDLHVHGPRSGASARIEAVVHDLLATRAEIEREPRYASGPRNGAGRTATGLLADRYIANVRALERDPEDDGAYAAVARDRTAVLAAFDRAVKQRASVATARMDSLVAALFLGLILQIASIAGVWFAIVEPSERQGRKLLGDMLHAREEIESIFAQNPDAISVYDSGGRLLRVNSSLAKLLGNRAEALIGRHFSEFVSEPYLPSMIVAFERAVAGETVHTETKLVAVDGSLIDVSVTVFPRFVDGVRAGVNIVSKDMRALRAAQAANVEQARRLADLYDIASCYDRTTDELLHSAIGLVSARLGYAYGILVEIADDVMTVVSTYGNPADVVPGERRPVRSSLAQLAAETDGIFEFRQFQDTKWATGSLRTPGWHSVAGMKILIDGKLYGTVVFASGTERPADLSSADVAFMRLACALLGTIVERGRQIRRLDSLAFFDLLTGLPNRASFAQRLNEFVEAGAPFALHYVDLDRFKMVNDRFGHSVGDVVLDVTAKRLTHCARSSDVVARLGGDEFAILQCGPVDDGRAAHLAARIVEIFFDPIDLDGVAHDVGASVGVALFPANAHDASALLEAADTALYRAKRTGRRRVAFFQNGEAREGLATR